MSSERRYTSTEIEEIFARAARQAEDPTTRALESGGDGLTLAELQEIGREVGLAPLAVSEAAGSLARTSPTDGFERVMGLPLGVSRTVPLPRALTDDEWGRIVSDIRATFRATGRVQSEGGIRHWRNGNLHVFVEPAPEGYRLRMGTTRGRSRAFFRGGLGALGAAGVLAVVNLVSPDPDVPILIGMFSAGGLGGLIYGAIPLPTWARRRSEQFETLAARVTATLEAEANPDNAS